MSYSESSNDARPQSIVHHIGRLGSKITTPIFISKCRKRMRMQRKLQEDSMISSKQAVTASVSEAMDSTQISVAVSDDTSSYSPGDYHTMDSDDSFSFCFSDIDEDDTEDESLFETLDQNEFLVECFVTNGQSDVVFLVHFFNQETSISDAIEDILSIRVLETNSRCECRRINSKSAPLFTSKLYIDPEQPTVVAIKNGKILSKVSDISSSQCTEVDQWLARTRILKSNIASSDTFPGLSTKI